MKGLNIGGNSQHGPGGTPPGQPNQGPNLSQEEIDKMDSITCGECGGETFNSALKMKEIPSTHPASQPGGSTIQPVQVFACLNCGNSVNEQLQG